MTKKLWDLTESELENTFLANGDCPDCQRTGFKRIEAGEKSPCDCLNQFHGALAEAEFPMRFRGQTLAGFEWSVTQPTETAEFFQAYLTNLVLYRETGVNLVLLGNCGNGKTHWAVGLGKLACALNYTAHFITCTDLLELERGLVSGRYTPESDYRDYLRKDYVKNPLYSGPMQRWREVDWLIVDDVGYTGDSPWVRERLYSVFNHRYLHRLPTVITSNATVEHLETLLGEGLTSRLINDGVTLVFQGDDYRKTQKQRRQQVAKLAPSR